MRPTEADCDTQYVLLHDFERYLYCAVCPEYAELRFMSLYLLQNHCLAFVFVR